MSSELPIEQRFQSEGADYRLTRVVQQIAQARDLSVLLAIVRQAARLMTRADGVAVILREGEHCFYADEDAIGPLWKGRRFPVSPA